MVRDGRTPEGEAQLRLVAKRWPADSSAAQALYLLADLSTDDNDDRAARRTLLQLARQHPGSRQAAAASFRAAIIAYADRHVRGGREGAGRTRRTPADEPGGAGRRSTGRGAPMRPWAIPRARLRGGSEVIARDSMSYYADAAARRLGLPAWGPAASPDTFAVVPDLDSAWRGAPISSTTLMLDDEAALERARLGRSAATSSERLMAAADLMRRNGLPNQAISPGTKGPECRGTARCAPVSIAVPAGIPGGAPGRSQPRRRGCAPRRRAHAAGIAVRSRGDIVGRVRGA